MSPTISKRFDNLYLSGTLSGTTVSATNFSGTTATSGGGTAFAFATGGSATAGSTTITANRFLHVVVSGVNFYMPCFSTVVLS